MFSRKYICRILPYFCVLQLCCWTNKFLNKCIHQILYAKQFHLNTLICAFFAIWLFAAACPGNNIIAASQFDCFQNVQNYSLTESVHSSSLCVIFISKIRTYVQFLSKLNVSQKPTTKYKFVVPSKLLYCCTTPAMNNTAHKQII